LALSLGLLLRLATFNGVFAPLLKGSRYGSTARSALSQEAEKLRKLIHSVNERHAAKEGKDLFKMTNASAAALASIADPVSDAESYGNFIDGLYKLLYEGSGNCNRLPAPPPEFLMDLKHLRTGLRHDVDHGGDQEAAKKRLNIAKIFRLYSGKGSPAECSGEEFSGLQLKIVRKARRMLQALNS
jgi:hypothetical protein